nr:proteoglycan 4-like [Misgurnus anguillicaudatus]
MDFVLPNGVLSSEIVQHPGPSSEAINSVCFEEEGGDENAENISSGKKTAKSIKRRIAKFFRTIGKKIKSPFVHCFGRNKVVSFVPSPELNPGKASDDLVKSEMKSSSGMKADDDISHPVAKADYDLLNTTKPEDVSSAPQHYTGTSSVSIPQFVIPRADTSLHIVDFSEDDSVDTVLNARTNPANPKPKKPTSSTSDEVLGAIGFTSRMYPKSHESDDKRGFINPCEPKEKTDTNPANPKPKKPTSSTSDEMLGTSGFTSRMYPKSHESDGKQGFINPCEPKEKTDTIPGNPKPKKLTSSTSDEMLGTSGFTSRMYPKSHESDGKQGFINPCEPKEKTDTNPANPKPKKPTSSTSDEMLGAIGFTSKVYQEREDSDGKQVAIKQVWEWKHNPYTDIKVNNNSNDANFKTGTIPKTKGFINPYELKEKMDANPAKPKPKKPTSSTSDEVVGAIGFTSKVYQEREDSDGKQVNIKQVSKWTRNPCINIKADNNPGNAKLKTGTIPKAKAGTVVGNPVRKPIAIPCGIMVKADPKPAIPKKTAVFHERDKKVKADPKPAIPKKPAVFHNRDKKVKADPKPAIPKKTAVFHERDKKVKAVTKPAIPKKTADTEVKAYSEEINAAHRTLCDDYCIDTDNPLGKGSFGAVFPGTSKADGKPVAIKFVKRRQPNRYFIMPGSGMVLTELVVLHTLKEDPNPHVIKLYDSYEDPDYFILVMERPDPCMTLNEFIKLQRGLLESTARILMRQAVMAVKHCFKHETFHTDLHAGNFLVDKNNMLLKLIDFGCCDRLRDTAYAYEEYLGAPAYRPPEVRNRGRYHAMSSSVWSLGTLLYYMVNVNLPFPKYGPVTEGTINHENDYLTKRKNPSKSI